VEREPVSWSGAARALSPGEYVHFKGGRYRVVGVAHHSETMEELVVYEHVGEDRGLWVRPLAMWHEIVERDGYRGPRFTKV
jgi:hypothetical protein